MARRLLWGVRPSLCVNGALCAVAFGFISTAAHSSYLDPSVSQNPRQHGTDGIRRDQGVQVAQNGLYPGLPMPFPMLQPRQPGWNQPPPQWNQPPQYGQQQPQYGQQQGQPQQQSAEGARAEQAFRNALVMKGISGGFGGIFGPGLRKWAQTPSAPSEAKCGGYSDHVAQQACKNDDIWAADRLQNNQSTESERSWYDR